LITTLPTGDHANLIESIISNLCCVVTYVATKSERLSVSRHLAQFAVRKRPRIYGNWQRVRGRANQVTNGRFRRLSVECASSGEKVTPVTSSGGGGRKKGRWAASEKERWPGRRTMTNLARVRGDRRPCLPDQHLGVASPVRRRSDGFGMPAPRYPGGQRPRARTRAPPKTRPPPCSNLEVDAAGASPSSPRPLQTGTPAPKRSQMRGGSGPRCAN